MWKLFLELALLSGFLGLLRWLIIWGLRLVLHLVNKEFWKVIDPPNPPELKTASHSQKKSAADNQHIKDSKNCARIRIRNGVFVFSRPWLHPALLIEPLHSTSTCAVIKVFLSGESFWWAELQIRINRDGEQRWQAHWLCLSHSRLTFVNDYRLQAFLSRPPPVSLSHK